MRQAAPLRRPTPSGDPEASHSGEAHALTPALVYGNLEIRPDELQVLAGGRRVGLTVREFQVLLVLAEREDRVVRRLEIYDRVWGGEMKRRDRSVDVFVRKVRVKLAHRRAGLGLHPHPFWGRIPLRRNTAAPPLRVIGNIFASLLFPTGSQRYTPKTSADKGFFAVPRRASAVLANVSNISLD